MGRLAAAILLLALSPAFAAPPVVSITDLRPPRPSSPAPEGPRHAGSGMSCPASLPGYDLFYPEVGPQAGATPGFDSCAYARKICNRCDAALLVAELRISFRKASRRTTLDSVFARARASITAAHPRAVARPAALHIGDRDDYRAIGYDIARNGSPFVARAPWPYHWELVVGLQKGWIVEVRAKYPGSIVANDSQALDLTSQLEDIQSAYLAYAAATGVPISSAFQPASDF
jgi:hypothetical protein